MSGHTEELSAFRATIAHCAASGSIEYFDDGLLVTENGRVQALGRADELTRTLPDTVPVTDLSGKLLLPGFIDCHVHYPQLDIVASWGAQLLDWLNRYAYPAEMRFDEAAFARETAERFADRLLANGTTTALVFATVHPQSVDAMFEAARARRMRLITGKTAMDVECPAALRDTPATAARDSRALIERWHGVDRLGYALTPRFALTSSGEQLTELGRLAAEYPDVHVHTHLAEHPDEIAAVQKRFPDCDSYLDVYDSHGLLRDRSVFAHCLHLPSGDLERLAQQRGSIAFCPSSNLFLGSGLFDFAAADNAGVRVGAGTDVGGGPSLSLPRTLADAYRVLQLQGQSLPAGDALHLITLGAAEALGLDEYIGNFAAGKEADFVVMDPAPDGPAAARISRAESFEERLFALLMLGDDRDVFGTWLLGEPAFRR